MHQIVFSLVSVFEISPQSLDDRAGMSCLGHTLLQQGFQEVIGIHFEKDFLVSEKILEVFVFEVVGKEIFSFLFAIFL